MHRNKGQKARGRLRSSKLGWGGRRSEMFSPGGVVGLGVNEFAVRGT